MKGKAQQLLVIKAGGTILDNAHLLRNISDDLRWAWDLGYRLVLVHGGSSTIQRELDIHGVPGNFKDGLRVTSAEAMDIVEMALCGSVNTRLVRSLNRAGLPAVGMSGLDAGMISAKQYSSEHEQTGKVTAIHRDVILHLSKDRENAASYIPVIAPVGAGDKGKAMNINADWAAAAIAVSLETDTLIYISDQPGILNSEGETIPVLDKEDLITLIHRKTVQGGMLTKARSICYALDNGIPLVRIINGREAASLRKILGDTGTDFRGNSSCIVMNRNDKKKRYMNTIFTENRVQPGLQHYIDGSEIEKEGLRNLLDLAGNIKQYPQQYCHSLRHRYVALLFEKPSLRSRISFTIGIQAMGGMVVESTASSRHAEEPRDIIRVIQAYCHAVVVRTHAEEMLYEMRRYSRIPIINALTEHYHPCQALADMLTLSEHFGSLEGLHLAFIGDGNNVLRSLINIAPHLGVVLHYCCPRGRHPQETTAHKNGSSNIVSFDSPEKAVQGCDAVYTDVWQSMNCPAVDESIFTQVNEELMNHAKADAVFMHCMPMHRGKEVSADLPESERSLVFQQSRNRLYTQQALLHTLIHKVQYKENNPNG